jgi:hypothetical protein
MAGGKGFGYSFARAELTLNGKIYTGISGVSIDQPTEREAIKGSNPTPRAQTEGTMGLGEGTITFSDEAERLDFIDALGDGYRQKVWGLLYVLRATDGSRAERRIECSDCCVTGNAFEYEEGAAALGGEIAFSFLSHKVNGKSPHLP